VLFGSAIAERTSSVRADKSEC